MNQQNDQLVIGVAQGKRRMSGLGMRQIVRGSVTKLQLEEEWASCMSDHNHNHTRDGERMALGGSQHGEAFEVGVEDLKDKRQMMGGVERRGKKVSALI